MKIAIVSMVPIFPARAGHSVRILQLCRAIRSLGHDLTFIHFTSQIELQQPDDGAHVAFLGAERYIRLNDGNALERAAFSLYGKVTRRLRRARGVLWPDDPYRSGLDQIWRRAWSRQLRQLDQDFDVAIVEYVFNSRALLAFPERTRKLLDTHDSFADRHRPFVSQGFKRGYWISLSPADEIAGFRRADAIFAIQQEEAENFRTRLAQERKGADPEVAVVSHFLDLDRRPVHVQGSDHTALYVGHNMLSNQISLQIFLEQVLPLVLKVMPDFRFRIAGSICAWAPDHPNVDKLGFVDDLKQAFADASLSINPTLAGTGINIKLLDAMCAGVPTVCTTTGARGLAVEFRNGVVVVADRDHQAFADEVVRLASDQTLRHALGQAAYSDAQRWNAQQLASLHNCLHGVRRAPGVGVDG